MNETRSAVSTTFLQIPALASDDAAKIIFAPPNDFVAQFQIEIAFYSKSDSKCSVRMTFLLVGFGPHRKKNS